MNRAELQIMADERLKDARALIDANRWEFAYYVAGYSVECALKSCVLARMVHTAWIFEAKADAKAKSCQTHDVMDLIELAGMKDILNHELQTSSAGDSVFTGNWRLVKLWEVSSRYTTRTEMEARQLYAAIDDQPKGVLTWIRQYW